VNNPVPKQELVQCAIIDEFSEKHIKTFFGRNTTKGLHNLRGRKFVSKSRTKTFRPSLGKFG